MDKTKYIKWYNLAKSIVNDPELIPDRTDQKIMDEFVSREDWLMFAPAFISTKEEAKNAPIPNVYFVLYKEGSKRFGRVGLTFNTIKAVERLKNILSDYSSEEKEELVKRLLSLEGVWKISVDRKIRHNFLAKPEYFPVFKCQSNEIDKSIIDKIIIASDNIREDGREKREKMKLTKRSYTETPSMDLMVCEFELSEDEFKKKVKEAFDVLKICLNVKTNAQIRKLEKQQKKEPIEEPVTKVLTCPNPGCGRGIRARVIDKSLARCGACGHKFAISDEQIDKSSE